MKFGLFLILILSSKFIFCQDSTVWNTTKINIELGYSSSMFFSNYTGHRINKNQAAYYPLSYIKLGFSKNRFSAFADFMDYYESNQTGSTRQNPVYVDSNFILHREYTILNLGFSYSFFIKKAKLFLEPCLLLSYREGREQVASWPRMGHITSYNISNYIYESYGLGAGLNLRKHIYKGFYIGASGYFQHFFQERRVIQERFNTYRYNKTMFSPIVKIGYQISL